MQLYNHCGIGRIYRSTTAVVKFITSMNIDRSGRSAKSRTRSGELTSPSPGRENAIGRGYPFLAPSVLKPDDYMNIYSPLPSLQSSCIALDPTVTLELLFSSISILHSYSALSVGKRAAAGLLVAHNLAPTLSPNFAQFQTLLS
jgi:hypothetical protein